MKAAVISRLRTGLISTGMLLLVGMALMFLMNVVLARRLGPTEFGKFSYVFAASAMVALLISLGIPATAMRFIAQYEDAGQWSLVGGVMRWSLKSALAMAMSATVVAIAVCAALPPASEIRGPLLWTAALIVPLVLWLWQRFVSLGFHRVTLALVPRDLAVPAILTGIALLPYFDTAAHMTFAYAITLLMAEVVACWLLFRGCPKVLREHAPVYDTRLWWSTAAPLMLTSISQLGMNRWDVLVLGAYGNLHETGIYNAAARLALLATLISRVVITVTGPLISAALNNGRVTELRLLMRRSLLITVAMGVPLTLFLMVAAHSLITLVYGEEYGAATTVLVILAMGQMFNLIGVPSSTLLWMGGGVRWQAAISLGGAIACLVLSVLLIPIWGGVGAAVATSSVMVVSNLLFIWLSKRRIDEMCAAHFTSATHLGKEKSVEA